MDALFKMVVWVTQNSSCLLGWSSHPLLMIIYRPSGPVLSGFFRNPPGKPCGVDSWIGRLERRKKPDEELQRRIEERDYAHLGDNRSDAFLNVRCFPANSQLLNVKLDAADEKTRNDFFCPNKLTAALYIGIGTIVPFYLHKNVFARTKRLNRLQAYSVFG